MRPAGVVFTLLALVAVPLRAAEDKPREEKDHLAERVARKVEHAKRKAERADAELAEKEREALKDFQKEVREYVHLHEKQLAKLGPPPDAADAEACVAMQKALAAAIRAKRDEARQGDIFEREVEPIFRRLVGAELKGPVGISAREAVREGNPKLEAGAVQVKVRVNGEYPLGAPLSTVPSSLLLTLPPLPTPLEYRFVGRDLILFDSTAGLIVDFLPSAAPRLGGPVNP